MSDMWVPRRVSGLKKTGFGKTRTVKERLAWHGGDTQLGGIVGKSLLKNTKNRVTIALFRNEERAPGCSGEKQGTFFYTVTWGYNKTVVKIPIKKPAWWKARVFFSVDHLFLSTLLKFKITFWPHHYGMLIWRLTMNHSHELPQAKPRKPHESYWLVHAGILIMALLVT